VILNVIEYRLNTIHQFSIWVENLTTETPDLKQSKPFSNQESSHGLSPSIKTIGHLFWSKE